MNSLMQPSNAKEFQIQVEDIVLLLYPVQRLLTTASEQDIALMDLTIHNHASAELFVCGEGRIRIIVEDNILTLYTGDALIIPPQINHRYMNEDNINTTKWHSVRFFCQKRDFPSDIGLYKTLLPLFSGNDIILFHDSIFLYQAVSDIKNEVKKTNGILPALQMLELLIKMARMQYNLVHDKNVSKQDSDMYRIENLENIISEQFMKDISIKDVAKVMHISSRHLERIVYKRYKKTFWQVITQKRITTAARLLQTTDISVEKICNSVGYDSRSSFYYEFKKQYNLTPAQFRKLHSDSS